MSCTALERTDPATKIDPKSLDHGIFFFFFIFNLFSEKNMKFLLKCLSELFQNFKTKPSSLGKRFSIKIKAIVQHKKLMLLSKYALLYMSVFI